MPHYFAPSRKNSVFKHFAEQIDIRRFHNRAEKAGSVYRQKFAEDIHGMRIHAVDLKRLLMLYAKHDQFNHKIAIRGDHIDHFLTLAAVILFLRAME